MNKLEFLVTDLTVRKFSLFFAIDLEKQIRAFYSQEREGEKGVWAWFSHLGKAVSFRRCLHFQVTEVGSGWYEGPASVWCFL